MAHFTTFVKWASVAVIASCLLSRVAGGQDHEPPGRELHPSYLLYYGPGDGTVRVVDPETGALGDPILGTSQGEVVWVHWFAYDWPHNRMYVVYSEGVDGSLLLGTANPHSWNIKPIAVIDTSANFGYPNDHFDVQGLAYSQATGVLYMNFGTSPYTSDYRGIIALNPENAKLSLDHRVVGIDAPALAGAFLAGRSMANDADGNIYYDHTDSGYSDGLTTYRKYWLTLPLDSYGHYSSSNVFPVRPGGYGFADVETFSPPGWSTCGFASDFYALAVEPETENMFVLTGGSLLPKGLSVLKFFAYTWNDAGALTLHYAHAESINDNVLVESSGKGLSLVFVPWQLPESTP